MLNTLITGSNGFVGSNMSDLLLSNLIKVKKISRDTKYKGKIIGDFSKIDDWTDIIGDSNIILHFSSRVHKKMKNINYSKIDYDADTIITLKLAKNAAKLGVKKFIFLSSIGVNGQISAQKFNRNSKYLPFSQYTNSKRNTEVKLLELQNNTNMEIVIVRSPLIYGKNAPGTFNLLYKALINNFPIPFGNIKDNKRSYISINNLTDFILFIILRNEKTNGIYLVSDNHDISTYDFMKMLKSKARSKSYIFWFPKFFLKLIFKIIRKENWISSTMGSLEIDCEETMNELGWKPPYDLENEIKNIFF